MTALGHGERSNAAERHQRGESRREWPEFIVMKLARLGLIAAALIAVMASAAPAETKLPKLLDLGAGRCIPCKLMAPILEELKKEYAGKLEVEFIDVWKTPDVAKQYKINLIPTQIFYDASGKELFRHEGFFGKADILAKWKELGVKLTDGK